MFFGYYRLYMSKTQTHTTFTGLLEEGSWTFTLVQGAHYPLLCRTFMTYGHMPSKTSLTFLLKTSRWVLGIISSLWRSQGRTVQITPLIIFFSSYSSLSLSSREFCPEISSETTGRIFANKVSYERFQWGVVPSLIFIALTGLIFQLLPIMWKNLLFGFLLRTIPTSVRSN